MKSEPLNFALTFILARKNELFIAAQKWLFEGDKSILIFVNERHSWVGVQFIPGKDPYDVGRYRPSHTWNVEEDIPNANGSYRYIVPLDVVFTQVELDILRDMRAL